MNQSNSIKRTAISFGFAVFIALLALSIQRNNNSKTELYQVEAKVYPEKAKLFGK